MRRHEARSQGALNTTTPTAVYPPIGRMATVIAASRETSDRHTDDGPLTESQARMLGQAIAVAAHNPASIRLLDRIDAEYGAGHAPRDTGVVVESWSAGGCHIFASALCGWINRCEDEGWPTAAPMVYATEERMIHVITSWRGWLFDDRGAWGAEEFLDIYGKYDGDGELLPYVASKYATANIPRRPGYVKRLEAIFESSLCSPGEWIPDARGFAFCGQNIIYRRVDRLLREPRYAKTDQWYVARSRRKVNER